MTTDHTARVLALHTNGLSASLPEAARDTYLAKAKELATKYGIILPWHSGRDCVCADHRNVVPTPAPEPQPAAGPKIHFVNADDLFNFNFGAPKARRSNTSHADCTHPKTKAARAACRKGRI